MNELNTPRYEDENDITTNFEELIAAIVPYIKGLNLTDAIPRIRQGVRGYFVNIGKPLTNFDENNLSRTRELPQRNHIFILNDARIAIALENETITIYQDMGEDWLKFITCSA